MQRVASLLPGIRRDPPPLVSTSGESWPVALYFQTHPGVLPLFLSPPEQICKKTQTKQTNQKTVPGQGQPDESLPGRMQVSPELEECGFNGFRRELCFLDMALVSSCAPKA